MSRRRACAFLLACLLAWIAIPANCEDSSAQKLLVLYVCPEETQQAQTLDVLRRMMMFMNLSADYVSADQKLTSLDQYSAVIVYVQDGIELDEQVASMLRGSEKPIFVIGQGAIGQLVSDAEYAYYEGSIVVRFSTKANLQNDLLVRGNGLTLLAGDTKSQEQTVFIAGDEHPLCQTLGQVTHLAYFDAQMPTMCMLLSNLIQSWLWPYQNEPTTYGQFLVLDNVYPFMEPADLMEITDMLEDEGVPYAITLMPIYANAEYPSMKRFCEYLRYVQSTGAGLILRAPLASLGQVDIEQLKEHITMAYSAYSLYGVYPLAMQVPEEYLLCEDGLDVVSGFRTLFLFEAERTVDMDELDTNIAYREGHQIIAPAYPVQFEFTTAYAQAIYLDPNEDVEVLRTQVKRIKASKRVLKSLTQMESTLYVGDQYVRAGIDGLYVNQKLVDTGYVAFQYDSDYTYDRGFFKYFTSQIETSNQIVLVFVSISCIVFLSMIILSRRAIRREIIFGTPAQIRRRKKKDTNTEHSDTGGE